MGCAKGYRTDLSLAECRERLDGIGGRYVETLHVSKAEVDRMIEAHKIEFSGNKNAVSGFSSVPGQPAAYFYFQPKKGLFVSGGKWEELVAGDVFDCVIMKNMGKFATRD